MMPTKRYEAASQPDDQLREPSAPVMRSVSSEEHLMDLNQISTAADDEALDDPRIEINSLHSSGDTP